MHLNPIEHSVATAERNAGGFPPKVALICDWFLPRLGGIEMHLRDLAIQLMRTGRKVEVITPFPGPGEVDGIRVHRLSVSRVPGFGFAWSPNLITKLRGQLERGEYDLVHSHFSIISPAAFFGMHEAVRLKLPTVLTFHSILRHFKWTMLAADVLFRWSRKPVALSAISRRVACDVEWISGAGTVTPLGNSTDIGFWQVPRKAGDPKILRLISVQRLHSKKRPDALLKLFYRLKKSCAGPLDLRLDVVGDGPERVSLENRVRQMSLDDCVVFHGRQEREAVRKLFSRAHAFINLTQLEAFGLACLEARCTGLPVFALGGNGLDDWSGGMPGVFLAETDEGVLKALLEWIRIEEMKFRSPSLPEVDPRLDWEAGIRNHLSLYEQARRRAASIMEPGA